MLAEIKNPLTASPAQNLEAALALLGKPGPRSVADMRALIMGLEAAMQAMPGSLTAKDFDTRHHFTPGIYMRELHIPAGTTLTGKIHSTEHLNILSQGKLSVWTEDGMKTLTASTVIKSKPGIKRVGFAHEDSVWITVHHNPSNEQDLTAVEGRLFFDDFKSAYLASDRSFETALGFIGVTPSEAAALVAVESDQTALDLIGIRLDASPIHGQGVFAAKPFAAGEVIAQARIAGKRTPVGRFCNHSATPNAEMVMRENGDVDLVALTSIESGAEILNDYYLAYARTRPGTSGRIELCQP